MQCFQICRKARVSQVLVFSHFGGVRLDISRTSSVVVFCSPPAYSTQISHSPHFPSLFPQDPVRREGGPRRRHHHRRDLLPHLGALPPAGVQEVEGRRDLSTPIPLSPKKRRRLVVNYFHSGERFWRSHPLISLYETRIPFFGGGSYLLFLW